jgi:hypothetical protein
MSFIEDFFLQIRISRNYEAFPKPYHIFCILLETSVLGVPLPTFVLFAALPHRRVEQRQSLLLKRLKLREKTGTSFSSPPVHPRVRPLHPCVCFEFSIFTPASLSARLPPLSHPCLPLCTPLSNRARIEDGGQQDALSDPGDGRRWTHPCPYPAAGRLLPQHHRLRFPLESHPPRDHHRTICPFRILL